MKAVSISQLGFDHSTKLVWTVLNFTTRGGEEKGSSGWLNIGLRIVNFPRDQSSFCGHPNQRTAVTIVIGNSQNLFDPSQNNKTCYYFHQVFLNRETKPGDHDQPVQLFTQESWIIRIRKNAGITVELQKTCLAFLDCSLRLSGRRNWRELE